MERNGRGFPGHRKKQLFLLNEVIAHYPWVRFSVEGIAKFLVWKSLSV